MVLHADINISFFIEGHAAGGTIKQESACRMPRLVVYQESILPCHKNAVACTAGKSMHLS